LKVTDGLIGHKNLHSHDDDDDDADDDDDD